MRDYVNIGSSPADEDCAQVGTDDYTVKSRKECTVFAEQIIRVCGEPRGTAAVVIKSFPHDFGTYREVCVSYDVEDEEGQEYAYMVESNAPNTWDDIARKELVA